MFTQKDLLATCHELGVSEVYRVGGAQAVAALAYGVEGIPRVDKIVGPGSAYVATAKALVSADCAIDFFAGPSEILILSSNGQPAWIAAVLIAQAEHDEDARAIFVTPNAKLARAVAEEVSRQMPVDDRRSILALERIGLARLDEFDIGDADRMGAERGEFGSIDSRPCRCILGRGACRREQRYGTCHRQRKTNHHVAPDPHEEAGRYAPRLSIRSSRPTAARNSDGSRAAAAPGSRSCSRNYPPC